MQAYKAAAGADTSLVLRKENCQQAMLGQSCSTHRGFLPHPLDVFQLVPILCQSTAPVLSAEQSLRLLSGELQMQVGTHMQ